MGIQNNDVRCEGEGLLRTALYEAGIELDDQKVGLLYRHLELVIHKNQTTNLTRIDGVEDGSYLHVVDSLLLLSAFDAAPKGSFMDIGTGAGYPGIPLAIVTGRKAMLVDSVRKKAAATPRMRPRIHTGQPSRKARDMAQRHSRLVTMP